MASCAAIGAWLVVAGCGGGAGHGPDSSADRAGGGDGAHVDAPATSEVAPTGDASGTGDTPGTNDAPVTVDAPAADQAIVTTDGGGDRADGPPALDAGGEVSPPEAGADGGSVETPPADAGGPGGGLAPLPASLERPCLVEGWGQPAYATFSDDGALYAIGSQTGVVRVLRTVDDQATLAIAAQDSPIVTLAVSPNGALIASAAFDGTVRVHRSNGELVFSNKPVTAPVKKVAFSPDGTRLAVLGTDSYVWGRVLSTTDGATVSTLRWSTVSYWASTAVFEPDGATVVTYGIAIVRWNATTGERLNVIEFENSTRSGLLDVSADGSTVVSGSYWATVHDGRDGHEILKDVGFSRDLSAMRLSADGKRVAVRFTGASGTVLYDTRAAGAGTTIQDGQQTLLALGGKGDDLIIQDGATFGEGNVAHWRVGARTHSTLKTPHGRAIKALRVSPDGQHRVVVDGSGTTRVTRFADGAPVATFSKAEYDDAWFWPPSSRVLIAAPSFVDVASLPSAQRQMLPAAQVDGQLAAVSASGDLLAYQTAASVVVRDRDGNVKRTLPLVGVPAFSPAGDRVAVGATDGSLRVFALDGGADVGPVQAHAGPVGAVAFTLDGKYVISGGDGLGVLWRVTDLASVRSFVVGTQAITTLALSPDGTLAVLGLYANPSYHARLFRIADGGLVATFGGFGSGFIVNAAAFSPDSKRVILGASDATIRTWCLP